jgi:hypothetical protein
LTEGRARRARPPLDAPSESMHDIGVAPVAKENKCNPPDTR